MNNDNMITFMEAMLYAMEDESPSKAIENQERRGQQSVVKNQRLPKKLNSHSKDNIEHAKQQYEKMGIIIVDEYDDLFWNVELPEGWEIKATDHTMWNNLFDNKGRKRANLFYKAAFYDRDAFINFDTRFHISVDHIADASSDYEVWKNSDYQGIVKDGEKIIFSTECVPATDDYWEDNIIRDDLKEQLEKYMSEHYPNYRDINSYWD